MGKPWADQPYPLLPSPPKTEGISPITIQCATEMCFAHNLMTRTLNSIILQYRQVTQPKDIADFLIYLQCWHEAVHHHHHFEETCLFPDIEAYSGQKGIMETNVEQHHAFEEGLKKFGEYVYSATPETWDRETFGGIIESFTPALTKHLRDEIPTLLALDKYGPEKLKKAFDDLEKKILDGKLDPYRVIPCGLGGIEASYDKNQQAPFPWFVPYLSRFWFMRRHKGSWRFCPCTPFGKRKELPFAVEEK